MPLLRNPDAQEIAERVAGKLLDASQQTSQAIPFVSASGHFFVGARLVALVPLQPHMTISLVQWGKFLFHITHRENVPTILAKGLHCVNEAKRLNIKCRSIADDGIQARRSESVIPVGEGGRIHDYVPLFFGARPSMLYAVKFNVPQEDVVYLVVRWNVLDLASTVFTDGHAATAGTEFYADKAKLNQVDRAAVGATIWNKPPDLRRKKAAEVLVRKYLPVGSIASLVVRDEGAKIKLAQVVKGRGLDLRIDVLPEFYYR